MFISEPEIKLSMRVSPLMKGVIAIKQPSLALLNYRG